MYSFTFHYTDELVNFGKGTEPAVLIHDIECELEIDVSTSSGSVEAVVSKVFLNGFDLSDGTDFTRSLAAMIIDAAQDEIANGGSLWDTIVDENDLSYHGLGGGDPDAYWEAAE